MPHRDKIENGKTSGTLRLQKWLSEMGLYSRRQAENLLVEGRIKINGALAKLGSQVNPLSDVIEIDGKRIGNKQPQRVYWLLHKPKQFLCSRKSQNELATIYDLPKLRKLPFLVQSVGRLDYMSEGLLLLSNDGEIINRLCHPSFKLERRYLVLADKRIENEHLAALEKKGINLEDGLAKAQITYSNSYNMGKSKGYWYYVSVHEGRNRLVRRIFAHFEATVLRLIRQGFGELTLPSELKAGDILQLTSEQIRYLKRSCKL